MNRDLLERVSESLTQGDSVLLTGMSGASRAFFLSELLQNAHNKILCLVASEEKAYDLMRDLQGFAERDRIFMFPGRDLVFVKENYSPAEISRVLTLQECLDHPHRSGFIITTPAALSYTMMSPADMAAGILLLKTGEEKSIEDIIRQLAANGYTRSDTVSRPGEFALRGGILDVYPLNQRGPYRIDFFGDYIETIRHFDVDSQRSGKQETSLKIFPADELAREPLTSHLLEYIPAETAIFFDEPREFYRLWDHNVKRHRELLREASKEGKVLRQLPLLERERLVAAIEERPVIFHSFFPGNIPQVKVALMEHISQQEMETFYGNYGLLFSRIQEWQHKGYQVEITVRSKPARERLKSDLSDNHITSVVLSDRVIDKGFISQTLQKVLVSEKDIWGKTGGKAARQRKRSQERVILEDLKLGDYVVHESYGIGIFRGVTHVESDGVTREYILLQYAGTDKLYLPIEKLDHLYKYTTSEDKSPRLSKLGGSEWERTKKKVSESIKEMAEQLLVLYAGRQARAGFTFSSDTPWQGQFEQDFPYEETPDQLKAIKDIKNDMETSRPMDRLICGDVGYGKTEVAMRAVFKAVMDGKQVAILVPTTVLAEQHFQTFTERFQNYPTGIEVLSRFRSSSEQKRIINDLKKGSVDIVIGTHRLLSADVQFKDLGLLVVDEEHRFGVAQKEKIKALKELVDVVSLSATPIPRSLHMSLTGLRDLSVIETPPPQRYPITTYVLEYNEEILAQAVFREIERGGQVFFVHNRIEDIHRVREHLEELLPGVKIGVGHGRMPEDELSKTMLDFLNNRFQVFLCTTIIESGLDMPNVNTIIVDEADKMGLAQLYQLRGRVGRSSRVAYAYLCYRPDKVITETAQKRLNAIREFNELGSGLKIALRDLEIRGAGNILGSQQHGFIHSVGFDMYCRLLEQETAKLKGESPREEASAQFDIDVDYYIPDAYIPDSGTKIRIYRRLLLAVDLDEIEEIRAELLDRFGPLPVPVDNFLKISSLRVKARDKEIKALRRRGKEVEISLGRNLPADFNQRAEGFRIKSLRTNSVILSLEGAASLESLGRILELI